MSISYLDDAGLTYFWGKIKTNIPKKVSDLTNDAGYITTETDPTVPSWAKASSKPSYTASEVGADASGTAASAVNTHNSSSTAHSDIRNAIPTNVSDLTNDAGYTTNVGTITGITMNGTSKGTSGVVDLGTVITAHQDISGKVDKSGDTMTGGLTTPYIRVEETPLTSTVSSGNMSVGEDNVATGHYSGTIGEENEVTGISSVAFGAGNEVTGNGSSALGRGLIVDSNAQHVTGRYNAADQQNTYVEIVGNGDSSSSRSNAYTLDWSGNAVYGGKVTAGAAPTANADLTTKLYVDTAVGTCGDMDSSVYDTDSDGVVDEAEAVTNVSGTGGIEFGLDANGKGQYRAVGASTWIPFLSGPTYTRFWTNESPTSNFAAQDVSFSYDAAIYDALRIVWEYNKSTGATADTWESSTNTISTTYDLSNGKISNYVSGNSKIFMGVVNFATTYAYMRRCWFVPINDPWSPKQLYTKLHFDQIYRANNANNDTAMLIPLLVDGVKY